MDAIPTSTHQRLGCELLMHVWKGGAAIFTAVDCNDSLEGQFVEYMYEQLSNVKENAVNRSVEDSDAVGAGLPFPHDDWKSTTSQPKLRHTRSDE